MVAEIIKAGESCHAKIIGIGDLFALCFTTLVFGQVFAGDSGDKKRNVTPAEGLVKAFKAADRLGLLKKDQARFRGYLSFEKSKTSAKLKTKKVSGKKFASHKRTFCEEGFSSQEQVRKKHSTIQEQIS